MKNNKQPEIRFSGFTEDWEQHKFADLFNRVKSYSLSRDVETKEETGVRYVHYGDIHTKVADKIDNQSKIPNINQGNFETLQQGDLILADASEDYQGIATPAVILESTRFDIVAGLHTIALRPKDANPLYLYYLINSEVFRKYGYRVGTGMKVFGISATNVLKFENLFPSYDEQKKIGAFFKQLDDTISLHQQELTVLKEIKQGFLQKMFPKEGRKVPEIRFPRFTDDWEQRNLGEESDVRDGTHASPKYFDKGHPLVTSKNLKDHGLDMTDVSLISNNDFKSINQRSKVNKGDILFGMIGTIGNPVLVERDDFAIKNVALIKEQKNILNHFLIQLLKSSVFDRYIKNENAGGTQKFLSLSKIRSFNFKVPSLEEQVAIAGFLGQLDDTIALHQRELDLLKETKKAFLQKMFV